MRGRLFTGYFLEEGIRATAGWRASCEPDGGFAGFGDGVRLCYDALRGVSRDLVEAVTEQELILPVMRLLGWADFLPQQGTAGGEDIPDLLLFANAESKRLAASEPNAGDRFRHAVVVGESKRFGRPLDSRDQAGGVEDPEDLVLFGNGGGARRGRAGGGTPHGQILRYLSARLILPPTAVSGGGSSRTVGFGVCMTTAPGRGHVGPVSAG